MDIQFNAEGGPAIYAKPPHRIVVACPAVFVTASGDEAHRDSGEEMNPRARVADHLQHGDGLAAD